ncbi:sensor histidine kinase [Streptomyces sp. NPDC060198]|uniref:sensor histidine kinase n=1 Tax=Streptomyces sp. NPDC060198 TaxID=3347070 RepID=UPI00364ED85B
MPSAPQRLALAHPRVFDSAQMLWVLVCVSAASFFGTWDPREPIPWWPGLALGTVATAALLWRRTHPREVVVVTGVCAITAVGLGYLATMLLLAPVMVALFSLALLDERRIAHFYGLGVVALMVPTAVLESPHFASFVIVTLNPAIGLFLPVAWGSALRLRRAFTDSLRARAEHAEHTREEEALRRVAEERVRIARELHDVVAHHLTLANAQATTAAHIIRKDPEQAAQLLNGLSATTSTALRELKSTVGLLRRPEDPDSPLEPAPKLEQLPDVVAALATTGLDVTVTTEGEPRQLSPAVDLTAFRIIQEALTNVSKHAGTTTAQVTLAYDEDLLTIAITNGRGRPAPPPPPSVNSGFGLISMRERALSAGGRFSSGPLPDGGYTATAELPVHF